ncbi:MAG: thioredoxin family protein, partial [Caulobacteraceae bacterium]|nr:thioredoxin family protein [Caulobacteraceae bacterium]
MRLRLALAALLAGACLVPAAVSAAPAPKMAIASLAELPTPLPLPYDESANANADVDAALAKAKATHRLLLIDLGGNWCPDCRLLAALMKQPELARFVADHYVVVTVDVGRFNKNLQIPARWGMDKVTGAPSLLIVDRHGKLIDQGHVAALADARHMTPQALADWLAKWT